MPNLEAQAAWVPVREIGIELARGGPNGNMNEQAKALLARTEFLDQQKASKSEIVQGHYEFNTYAEFNAIKSTLPLNCTVIINEMPTGTQTWGQGTNRWNGTTLTKSPHDPLTQAKSYTDTAKAEAIAETSIDATTKANAAEANSKTYVDGRVTKLSNITKIIPIVVDVNGDIPVWIQFGQLNFSKLHVDAASKIQEQLEVVNPSKINLTGAAYPITSDGASLTSWKAKASKIKAGVTQQLRFIATGDSWTEHNTISSSLMNLLRNEYGTVGTGWLYLGLERNYLDGVGISVSGYWALTQIGATEVFPHGTAPDGMVSTGSTVGGYVQFNNLTKGDLFTVFFNKSSGQFSYSVSGGAATTITPDPNGADVQSIEIPVVSGNNVRLTVLSASLILYGCHLRASTGSGVEYNKMGKGGSRGVDYLRVSPTAQANFNNFLLPDVVLIILGTNDYRTGASVESFKEGISAMIDGYRTNNPDCGIILLAPADSNAPELISQKKYRDAIYVLAKSKRAEFYNMYDDWNAFEKENQNGMWNDTLHVSPSGAYRIASKLFNQFLKV
ncbi:MAG TPA: GDSL-type esterase/lipase family protein [Acinetobacter johnsonii]|nr:GDSL-type esterase/lipase family protein [Acinetobacter johnsonii]